MWSRQFQNYFCRSVFASDCFRNCPKYGLSNAKNFQMLWKIVKSPRKGQKAQNRCQSIKAKVGSFGIILSVFWHNFHRNATIAYVYFFELFRWSTLASEILIVSFLLHPSILPSRALLFHLLPQWPFV